MLQNFLIYFKITKLIYKCNLKKQQNNNTKNQGENQTMYNMQVH